MAKKLPEHLLSAIDRYLEGIASPEEIERVNSWYSSFDDQLVELPTHNLDAESQTEARIRMRLQQALDKSDRKVISHPSSNRTLIRRVSAAAAITLITLSGYLFLRQTEDVYVAKEKKRTEKEIQNPEEKIILTLQNGSLISVSDAAPGELVRTADFAISKNSDGSLLYTSLKPADVDERPAISHKLRTPQGQQLQLTLPDKSKVWINASTEFNFPVFATNEQYNTELNGEAYFEVSPNKYRKFRIRSGKQMTEVLGTRFNLSAYQNEPSINTTLIEGSIRITNLNTNEDQVIKPGQQSRLTQTLEIVESEAEDFKAWTDGYFYFDNADIQTVMRDLERWYGITVSYEGKITSQKFEGAIDKNLSLQQVLDILSKSDVHFEVSEKRVTVLP